MNKFPLLCLQVSQFLHKINIKSVDELNQPRTLINLSDMEKKTLTNELIRYAVGEKGVSTDKIKRIVTTFYILSDICVLVFSK